jgi:hypothetical protein
MRILILLSLISKLKPSIDFLISLAGACAFIFSSVLVCVSLVSTGFVRATCVSTSGLVTTASFALFLDKIFFGGTFVGFFSLGLKSYFYWSLTIIESESPSYADSPRLLILSSL